MNRYYLEPGSWSGNTLALSGDEAHHAARVMREKIGNTIEIFDGQGKAAVCQISTTNKKHLSATIQSTHLQEKTDYPITLFQAIPKGSNMELIIQKAVELGVSAIQPLITEHTIARPESATKKTAKWQRIALEACKQCGQNYLPAVHEPLQFSKWISEPDHDSLKIIAALTPESKTFHEILAKRPASRPVALLVGPEGDFSPEEYNSAFQHDFAPVTLGNIVLRVETATIYCLSIIKHELNH